MPLSITVDGDRQEPGAAEGLKWEFDFKQICLEYFCERWP